MSEFQMTAKIMQENALLLGETNIKELNDIMSLDES